MYSGLRPAIEGSQHLIAQGPSHLDLLQTCGALVTLATPLALEGACLSAVEGGGLGAWGVGGAKRDSWLTQRSAPLV